MRFNYFIAGFLVHAGFIAVATKMHIGWVITDFGLAFFNLLIAEKIFKYRKGF